MYTALADTTVPVPAPSSRWLWVAGIAVLGVGSYFWLKPTKKASRGGWFQFNPRRPRRAHKHRGRRGPQFKYKLTLIDEMGTPIPWSTHRTKRARDKAAKKLRGEIARSRLPQRKVVLR